MLQPPLSSARRTLATLMAVLAAFAVLASLGAGGADAGKKAKPAKVSLKVTTKNQAALLSANKLSVRVTSTGRTKVRLSVKKGKRGGLVKARTVKFKKNRKQAKRVKLSLTARGRSTLGACGAQRVTVRGKYTKKVRKKGRLRKRKATARRSKKLASDASRCTPSPSPSPSPDPPAPPVPAKPVCDPLDPAVCAQPWPSDYYTVADGSTETGKRLSIPREAMPANTAGVHIDTTDMNRADGFSPGNMIITKIPEVSTPGAFENSGLVPLTDMEAYDDPDQAVVVINAETGERHPVWAELDSNPTSVNPSGSGPGGIDQNPANTGPVNLIVRPAVNFEHGTRYVVALRNLRDAAGRPVRARAPFATCRDRAATQDEDLRDRCESLEPVFGTLTAAGVARDSSLYLAWDFTVASQESVTGRALTIRDDAFARLGDTNLADRKIQGASPTVDVLAYCDKSNTASAQCGDNYPGTETYEPELPTTSPIPGSSEQRTVVGYIRDVPCYLNQDGCPPGATFAFDAQGELTWNPAHTMDVPFRCLVPMSVVDTGAVVPGGTGVYGHGLLGTLNQINATRTVANANNSTWCGANWDGFSTLDAGSVVASLRDMSNFPKMGDRMQQGFLNFLMLARAMAHPDGFADEPAFTMTHNGNVDIPDGPAIDTSAGEDTRGYIMGISQGGIMGGALTALSPDADYGVLGVPGMNYSTLLRRSVDSDAYFQAPGIGLYANYPDLLVRPLLLSAVQLLWDRGETNGYAHSLNAANDPAPGLSSLPNTPSHEVLLRVALGDHQVSNIAAEVEARTIGASRYAPTLLPGRHWESDPQFLGIPPVTPGAVAPFTDGNVMVYYDGGPIDCDVAPSSCDDVGSEVPPIQNVPPRPEWGYGEDPHSYPRASADGVSHASTFLQGLGVGLCPGGATGDNYCLSNEWNGLMPSP